MTQTLQMKLLLLIMIKKENAPAPFQAILKKLVPGIGYLNNVEQVQFIRSDGNVTDQGYFLTNG